MYGCGVYKNHHSRMSDEFPEVFINYFSSKNACVNLNVSPKVAMTENKLSLQCRIGAAYRLSREMLI
jgi:hypothetical protein